MKLNHLFYKLIWNGGNERVKRDILCNDHEHGGLRMFDLHLFSYAQNLFGLNNSLTMLTPVF